MKTNLSLDEENKEKELEAAKEKAEKLKEREKKPKGNSILPQLQGATPSQKSTISLFLQKPGNLQKLKAKIAEKRANSGKSRPSPITNEIEKDSPSSTNQKKSSSIKEKIQKRKSKKNILLQTSSTFFNPKY